MMLVFAFAASGCATITKGRYQNIPVASNPSGAKVIVDGKEYQTPCTMRLKRSQHLYKVRIEKEGYEPTEATLRRVTPGWGVFWGWGNIWVPGVIVDWCTGAVYNLIPTKLEVSLAQQK
ncbi:MAG: PEGA domain-containing protein [Candidatus Paceibacterota bacterium]